MCGFLVVFDVAQQALDLDNKSVELARKFLHARGPDEFNIHRFRSGFAIHSRLKIRGGARGIQPVVGDNGVMVYNGELYNLGSKYDSDTEYLYSHLSDILDGSSPIDGIFAGVHIDFVRERYGLFRDRWGAKPLFYSINGTKILASSSLRLLASLIRPELCEKSIELYTELGFFPGAKTPFKEIFKAPIGKAVLLSHDGCQVNQEAIDLKSRDEEFKGFDSIEKAVSSQMVSDVPVGLLLSGGVDSSILAKLMDGRDGIQFFNITSQDFKNLNEKENISIVRQDLSNPIVEIEIKAEDLERGCDDALSSIDLPVADSSIFLNQLIYSKVKSHNIVVCLTGVGADELFGGYTRFALIPYLSSINVLRKFIPKRILRILALIPKNPRIRRFIRHGCTNYVDLFSDSAKGCQSQYFVPTSKSAILKFEREEYLCNCLLSFTDGLSMANSIEARIPYLSDLIATNEVVNGKYFYPKKSFLKQIRRRIFSKKFDETKKGFAIRNDELTDMSFVPHLRHRDELGGYILREYLGRLGYEYAAK